MWDFLEVLPFTGVSDDDLLDYFEGNNSNDSSNNFNLQNLNSLNFNQFYNYASNEDDENEIMLRNFINNNIDISKCSYHLSDSYENILSETTEINSLSFCCLNINSVPKNLLPFQSLCVDELTRGFDVIGLVETKLSDEISHLYNIPSYNKHLLNNSRHSGGIAIYCKNSLSISQRPDLNKRTNHIESLFIEIESNTKNIICGIIYHRPNSSTANFINDLESILSGIDSENKSIYIMGDFNINLLNYPTCNLAESLVNLFHSYNLVNLINKPTRVTENSATLIDHIWTNNYMNTKHSGILYESISDHFPIFTLFNTKPNKTFTSSKKQIQYRDNSAQNINALNNLLEQVNWDLITNNNNPETSYNNFILIFQSCYNKCIPLITKTVNTKHLGKPYINGELKQLIREKNKLQRKYSKHPITYGKQYKRLRNQVTDKIRKAKSEYYSDKLRDSSGDSKGTWKVINNILNKNRKEETVPLFNDFSSDTLEPLDGLVTSDYVISNKFNEYFTRVGNILSERIEHNNIDFMNYMGNRVVDDFTFTPIVENDVVRLAGSLDDVAAGHDQIQSSVVKKSIEYIKKPLTHIINSSLDSGIFPSQLKIAKISPIYKKGNKKLFSNYRPISILPVFSKFFEKIVYQQLDDFINLNNIININQFGFRSKKSTTAAIIKLTDHILRSFDEHKYTVGVFLDLTKAFDTVRPFNITK